MFDWPLMVGNATREDVRDVVNFLQAGDEVPRLTNGAQVRSFEAEFAAYIGTRYACMVNSGASANMVTMAALKHLYGYGRVMVPVLAWVSDITAIMHAGLEPEFCDIEPDTLGMKAPADCTGFLAAMAVHCLGFRCDLPAVRVIEDCCEALGAEHGGAKLGSFGLASNFSFYYSHHITTVEGGMICTNDAEFYETCRMLRGHGLLRECSDADYRQNIEQSFPDLDPQFIFVMPGFNVRPTEIQAVMGRSQLKRLEENVAARGANLRLFLSALDPALYRTQYRVEGSSSFALPLVLNHPDSGLMNCVISLLQASGIEYRRGTVGGGNQLRHPYLRSLYGDRYKDFPQAEHAHHFGLFVGNYPSLETWKIEALTEKLNKL